MFKLFLIIYTIIYYCNGFTYKYLKESDSRLIGTLFQFQLPDGKYNSSFGFLGIRYAKPPVGELRFKPPVEETWENKEYDFRNKGEQCMYMENRRIFGSEDCLNLDVYVPAGTDVPKEMPTFVYFNNPSDEKYKIYTNPESPLFLLRNNMGVLYVVNYRTGPFGFLHTKAHKIPGNIGLKDQFMALEWISKNNHYFQGKSPITIIGDYDSASHAYLHMFSEKSKGKFDGLITHNSNGFGTWKLLNDTSHLTKLLARKLYCYYENEELVIEYLQDVDAEEILLAASKIDQYGEGVQGIFKPIIEGEREDAFLPTDPLTILSNHGGSDVPWLNGRIAQSGLRKANEYLKAGKSIKYFDFRQLLPNYIMNSENAVSELIAEIKKIYTNSSENECNRLINPDMSEDELYERLGRNFKLFTDFDILVANDAMMLQYLYRNQSTDKYLISSENTINYQNNLCGISKNIFRIPEISSLLPENVMTSINWRFVSVGNMGKEPADEEYIENNMEENNDRIEKIRNLFSKHVSLTLN